MRVQIVVTAAGPHGRIVAMNGEVVWTTEVYSSMEAAYAAFNLLPGLPSLGQRRTASSPQGRYLTYGDTEYPIEIIDEQETSD